MTELSLGQVAGAPIAVQNSLDRENQIQTGVA